MALAAWLAGLASGLAETPASSPAAELGSLRGQAIAAAQAAQAQERNIAALARELDLLRREAAGRQRGLDESRAEQAELLGIIARLARNPPETVPLGPGSPLDQARGRMLIDATVRELRAEAQALAHEIERVAALREEIGEKESEVAGARAALGQRRDALAEILARRLTLSRKLLPEMADSEKQIAKLGREAADLAELIKRADAELDRRDKDLLVGASETLAKAKANSPALVLADPSRPRGLRAFDAAQPALAMPVAGTLANGFGAVEPGGNPSAGLRIAAISGAIVVAPADAQVVYAGSFRDYGPTLILRHGNGYHSVLAGLGRLDIGNGQWVLAGEPVGAMPEAAGDGPAGKLYIELRRDGRPVDPQPWLANRD